MGCLLVEETLLVVMEKLVLKVPSALVGLGSTVRGSSQGNPALVS